ncbi:sulfotransferase 1A1 [Aplysia californica]|uniref:Sulfotransferase 1A1 n=1 Tax=Aplysia californica TaxID=6500 RepID=A0ABM0ZXW2_APLCA|nr:sulfotransferase 1A1 [Aplysia californica]
MILRQSTDIEKTRMYNVTPEFISSEELKNDIPKLPSPRVLQYHLPFDRFPLQVLAIKPRVVYIARNPKDVMVSAFSFFTGLKDTYKFKGTWEDMFELSVSGQFPPGSWFKHVLDAEQFIREHPDLPVQVVVYEKLKESPVEEITKICQFLGKPDALAEKIAEAVAFNKFKANMQKEKLAEIESLRFEKDSSGVLRKGVVGDWRNWFSEEQNKEFDKVYLDKMKDSPIGNLLKKYMM